MAERRMFAKTIVLSDAFLDMPLSARCLYFTLGMVADDDGFVNNPKSIMRQCGAQEDDIKLLLAKKFLLSFDTGVIVIKHWRMNNYLQKDRYRETKYLEEKSKLSIDKNGAYHDVNSMYTQNMYTQSMYTQDSIGKDSIVKDSIGKDSIGEDNGSCNNSAREENELGAVMSLYLDRVQATPSSTCLDELKDYTERLTGPVVIHAINIAIDNGKANWAYIRGILQNYHRNGLNNLDAVQKSENEYQAKKAESKPGGKSTQEKRSHSFSELIEMGVFDDDG
mgnify:CR=1 FL=1